MIAQPLRHRQRVVAGLRQIPEQLPHRRRRLEPVLRPVTANEPPSHLLRYDDARRGHARRVLVRGDALAAVSLRGDWSAEGWLREYLEGGLPVTQLGRLLLKPGSSAPSGFRARGRVVCNCWNVGESEIVTTLERLDGSATERLSSLQSQLKCGTQCGSCLPELKRMVADTRGTVSA